MRTGKATWTIGFVGLAIALGSCGGIRNADQPAPADPEAVGQISTGLHLGQSRHDVRGVRFDIVDAGASCDTRSLASITRAFEPAGLPSGMSPAGSGEHGFADGLFVLPAGQYKACATPLGADAAPSMACGRAEATITVVIGRIVAVILVSQCRGPVSGGVDVVTALNDPPTITSLAITPSKFIDTCRSATITAAASDPDRDALTYEWTVDPATGGMLAAAGATATFTPLTPGDYNITLTVSDVHAAKTSLSFPIHAAMCVPPPPPAAPEAVTALINTKCQPCHTTGMSGMLKMDTAENIHANLVGRNSSNAACATRVRAIPGNSAASYIIAKLKGEVGICGTQMPRTPAGETPPRPPLTDAERAIIEAWIDSLPH